MYFEIDLTGPAIVGGPGATPVAHPPAEIRGWPDSVLADPSARGCQPPLSQFLGRAFWPVVTETPPHDDATQIITGDGPPVIDAANERVVVTRIIADRPADDLRPTKRAAVKAEADARIDALTGSGDTREMLHTVARAVLLVDRGPARAPSEESELDGLRGLFGAIDAIRAREAAALAALDALPTAAAIAAYDPTLDPGW